MFFCRSFSVSEEDRSPLAKAGKNNTLMDSGGERDKGGVFDGGDSDGDEEELSFKSLKRAFSSSDEVNKPLSCSLQNKKRKTRNCVKEEPERVRTLADLDFFRNVPKKDKENEKGEDDSLEEDEVEVVKRVASQLAEGEDTAEEEVEEVEMLPSCREVPQRTKHELEESLPRRRRRKERPIPLDMKSCKMTANVTEVEFGEGEAGGEFVGRRFLSRIVPEDSKTAEEELSRHLGREDFLRMEPVGQFNRGFVVARLDQDLFIVDQV